MRKPSRTHVQSALVGGAIAVALVGGGYAAKQLVESGASTVTLAARNGTLQALVHSQAAPQSVVFLGPFAHHKKGYAECGPAVRLMTGALRRTTPPIRRSKAANCVGLATERQIQTLQRRHKIPASGIYGLRTHKALAHAYSAQQRRDLRYLAHVRYVALYRKTIKIVAAHAVRVGGCCLSYSQSGSRSYFPAYPRLPPATDCSGFATWLELQAGAGKALGYPPLGWTGTMAYQGFVVQSGKQLQPGDLVLYPSSRARGPPWGHVAVVIAPGPHGTGLVISHGGPGVKILPVNYRPIGQVRRLVA